MKLRVPNGKISPEKIKKIIENTSNKHRRLLLEFILAGPFKGRWHLNVPIGKKYSRPDRIDIVYIESTDNTIARKYKRKTFLKLSIFSKKNVWIIEIKPKLDSEALGQILVYETIFLKDHPRAIVEGKCIVCEDPKQSVIETCKRIGIQVWQRKESRLFPSFRKLG